VWITEPAGQVLCVTCEEAGGWTGTSMRDRNVGAVAPEA